MDWMPDIVNRRAKKEDKQKTKNYKDKEGRWLFSNAKSIEIWNYGCAGFPFSAHISFKIVIEYVKINKAICIVLIRKRILLKAKPIQKSVWK